MMDAGRKMHFDDGDKYIELPVQDLNEKDDDKMERPVSQVQNYLNPSDKLNSTSGYGDAYLAMVDDTEVGPHEDVSLLVKNDKKEASAGGKSHDGSNDKKPIDKMSVDILHHTPDDKTKANASLEDHLLNEDKLIKENLDEKNEGVAAGSGSTEPYVGMVFKSEEAARAFYNSYARFVGFSIRCGSTKRARGGKCVGRCFVCSREGFRRSKGGGTDGPNKRKGLVTREGCKAALQVQREKSGRWVVKRFVKDHNHAFVDPSEVQNLRSHRNFTRAMQNLIDACMASGLHSDLLGSYLKEKSGGTGIVPTVDQDSEIHDNSLRRKNLKKGDVQSILNYFKSLQAENPSFIYATQTDKDGHLTSFFWTDARSRMDYDYFGDVVMLDSTLKESKSDVPYVSFTGVNHHQDTIFFGFSLLTEETESSYIWLFSTFLEAMLGRHPISLLTYQNQAVTAAVSKVFPHTRHRLSWHHILGAIRENLSHVYDTNVSFGDDLLKCIHLTETISDFQECWNYLMTRHELTDNEWVQSLYSIRHQWVPAYFRDTFFAETPMTDWTENALPIFNECINLDMTSPEFVKQYKVVLENRHEKELQADFETNRTLPILKTSWPLEKQAADMYTKSVFARFQNEFVECFGYFIEEVENDGMVVMYRVIKYGEEKRTCIVRLDIPSMRANCSCRMFEFSGILCRHVLIVFVQRSIIILPSYYILKRFTRNAKNVIASESCTEGALQGSCSLRYNDLCRRVNKFAENGAASLDAYNIVIQALNSAYGEFSVLKENSIVEQVARNVSSENGGENEAGNLMNQLNTRDARQLKSQKKSRHCVICKGHNHDKRNCPASRPSSVVEGLIPSGDDDVQNDQGFQWSNGEELGLSIGIPIFPSNSR